MLTISNIKIKAVCQNSTERDVSIVSISNTKIWASSSVRLHLCIAVLTLTHYQLTQWIYEHTDVKQPQYLHSSSLQCRVSWQTFVNLHQTNRRAELMCMSLVLLVINQRLGQFKCWPHVGPKCYSPRVWINGCHHLDFLEWGVRNWTRAWGKEGYHDLTVNGTIMYKIIIISYYSETIDWDHKLYGKLFTEVMNQGRYLDFFLQPIESPPLAIRKKAG